MSLVGRRQCLVQDITSLAQLVQRQLTSAGARTTVGSGPGEWVYFSAWLVIHKASEWDEPL